MSCVMIGKSFRAIKNYQPVIWASSQSNCVIEEHQNFIASIVPHLYYIILLW